MKAAAKQATVKESLTVQARLAHELAPGMVPCTEKEFFATVGQLNVHPNTRRGPSGSYAEGGYSLWEHIVTRELLGVSVTAASYQRGTSSYAVKASIAKATGEAA